MQFALYLFVLTFSITNPTTSIEDSELAPANYYIEASLTGGFNYYHCCCDGNGILCTGMETQIKCRPGGIFECLNEYSSEPDYNVVSDCDACCEANNGNSCA